LHGLKFQKIQWTVVERAWQAKSMLDQNGFARFVAFIHAADLRNGRVRFVNDEQIIVRQKIEERVFGCEPGGRPEM